MGHLVRVVIALTSALALFAAGEAIALASVPGSVAVGTTHCQQARTLAALAKHQLPALTLSEAKSCWPHARVAQGLMSEPGEYVIPHGAGWVHAGYSVVFSVDGHDLSTRDALAWACGQSVTVTVDSWVQWATYVDWHTGNTVHVCDYAYNNWKTPYCQGFGNCATPSVGVIGNKTDMVNPWYDQIVYYGVGTETFFCRHYIYAATATAAYWCK